MKGSQKVSLPTLMTLLEIYLPRPKDEVNVVAHLGLHKAQHGGDKVGAGVTMVVA
jgi:hypothetical protein